MLLEAHEYTEMPIVYWYYFGTKINSLASHVCGFQYNQCMHQTWPFQ